MVAGGSIVIAVLEDKREALESLCRRYGVATLHVFGSAASGEYREGESDVDFLVDFGPMDGYSKAHAYFDLLDELRNLLGTEVDLVMVGAVKNRYIAADIERTKRMLYAA